ncbi:hypothetical protein FRC17_006607 [Serendipita sp. 399]|nr:hypothetical protein FRC17_006607 [Serendipita sp. 399]
MQSHRNRVPGSDYNSETGNQLSEFRKICTIQAGPHDFIGKMSTSDRENWKENWGVVYKIVETGLEATFVWMNYERGGPPKCPITSLHTHWDDEKLKISRSPDNLLESPVQDPHFGRLSSIDPIVSSPNHRLYCVEINYLHSIIVLELVNVEKSAPNKIVPRPQGSHSSGFNLSKVLQAEHDVNKKTYNVVMTRVRAAVTKAGLEGRWAKHNSSAVGDVFIIMRAEFPFLAEYEGDWATAQFVKQTLKNWRAKKVKISKAQAVVTTDDEDNNRGGERAAGEEDA